MPHTYAMALMWRFLFVVLGVVLTVPAFAETTTGEVSVELTKGLYCGAQALLEGNIGLILGLIFIAAGVWALMQGGKWVPALILMISGALITALPSLITSFFEAYGKAMKDAGIATNTFDSVSCSGSNTKDSYPDESKKGFGADYKNKHPETDPGAQSGAIFYDI